MRVSYRLIDRTTYGFKVGDYDRSLPLLIDPLVSATYFGSTDQDYLYDIAMDSSGSFYVTGWTKSLYFPTTEGAYTIDKLDYLDVFVSKLSADLSTLEASTFIGGGADDQGYAIALESSGNVVVTGTTKSQDYPTTPTAFDKRINGSQDAFVSRLDSTLSTLLASTYLGGASYDQAQAIVLDSEGHVYVAGYTQSKDFPINIVTAYDIYIGGSSDAFVAKLNPELNELMASTYFGGGSTEQINALAIDGTGNILAVGYSKSLDFPTTPYAVDRTYNGGNSDGFVAAFRNDLGILMASTFLGGSSEDLALSVAFDSSSNVFVAGYTTSANFPTRIGSYDRIHNGKEDAFVTKLAWDAQSETPQMSIVASTFVGGSSADYARALTLDESGMVYVAGSTKSANFPVQTGSSFDAVFSKGEDIFLAQLDNDLARLEASTYYGGTSDERVHAILIDSSANICIAGVTKSTDLLASDTAYQQALSGTKEDGLIAVFSSLAE